VRFSYPGPDDRALAVRLADGALVGYSSICTHLACGVLWEARQEELVCPCHEGRFSASTGEVLAGPPPRPLPVIELEERDDGVYAVGARVR
jgi:Rieske Fe-S protein